MKYSNSLNLYYVKVLKFMQKLAMMAFYFAKIYF
jgi:hypothetical protein